MALSIAITPSIMRRASGKQSGIAMRSIAKARIKINKSVT